MKSLHPIFFLLFFCSNNIAIYAQNDSVKLADTVRKRPIIQPLIDSNKLLLIDSLQKDSLFQDSLKKITLVPIQNSINKSAYDKYMQNAYLPMDATPIKMFIDFKKNQSKDFLFYLTFSIVFLLAIIKMLFPKYFKNLFILFFQTSLRQKQIREQLLQDWVASLLINGLFLISTGLFITLVVKQQLWSNLEFKTLYLYVIALLALIYAGKFVFVSFAGWVFNSKTVASGYSFLVLMVNRIMGILLIPFSIFLAFADIDTTKIVLTLSIILILLLLIYRYILSFTSLRNELKLNAFHFFLYLCAIEILPMLLLYKLMVNYIG